jgi:hypothetical protein
LGSPSLHAVPAGSLHDPQRYVRPSVQDLAGAVLVDRQVLSLHVPGNGVAHVSAPFPTRRSFTLGAKVLLGPLRPTWGCMDVDPAGPPRMGPYTNKMMPVKVFNLAWKLKDPPGSSFRRTPRHWTTISSPTNCQRTSRVPLAADDRSAPNGEIARW